MRRIREIIIQVLIFMKKSVGKIPADQDQIVIRKVFNAGADYPDAFGSFQEYELDFRMLMIGIREGFPNINFYV